MRKQLEGLQSILEQEPKPITFVATSTDSTIEVQITPNGSANVTVVPPKTNEATK